MIKLFHEFEMAFSARISVIATAINFAVSEHIILSITVFCMADRQIRKGNYSIESET